MWFTYVSEGSHAEVGWITPLGEVHEFPPSLIGELTPSSIVVGQDGNVWFTSPTITYPEETISFSYVGRIITPLLPSAETSPVVTGIPIVGELLSTSSGTWAHEPLELSDQWEICDPAGQNCASLPGTSGNSYLLTEGDVGRSIRARVTASNLAGTQAATSAPTAVIGGLTGPLAPLVIHPASPMRVLGVTMTWAPVPKGRGVRLASLVAHRVQQGTVVEV